MKYTTDEIKAMYDYWKMLYGKEVADEYLEYLKSFKKQTFVLICYYIHILEV